MRMSDPRLRPFQLPPIDSLPPTGTSLQDMIRFVGAFEMPVIRLFQERWGQRYKQRVQACWSDSIRRFKAGGAAEGPADELLLCLAYDCILGPYLGVPEPHKLVFWEWLVEGVRQAQLT